MKSLIVGSRESRLAMAQTMSVINMLDCDVEIKKISTRGDKITDVALAKIEGKGFFTKELDQALLSNEIDFAIHSLKDLPTVLPEGLEIAGIPKRKSARDVLLSPYKDLASLPHNAKVGTSSIRRRAELLHIRSDLVVAELRGNVDTRIKKLNEGNYDAIIVAEAGLERLNYTNYSPLHPKVFIPAVCQGALGVTTRKDDKEVIKILTMIDDLPTRQACEAERIFLSSLKAGCQIPAGAYTKIDIERDFYEIHGFISSLDGKKFITGQKTSIISEAKKISFELANKLLTSGGSKILEKIEIY